MNERKETPEDWGSWAKAERWRKESFAARTHVQRLQWLKAALRLHYHARAAGEPPAH